GVIHTEFPYPLREMDARRDRSRSAWVRGIVLLHCCWHRVEQRPSAVGVRPCREALLDEMLMQWHDSRLACLHCPRFGRALDGGYAVLLDHVRATELCDLACPGSGVSEYPRNPPSHGLCLGLRLPYGQCRAQDHLEFICGERLAFPIA